MAPGLDLRPNPFEFGAELSPSRLVDRQEEVEVVARTGVNRGRMFLLGARRFGKTSILAAAESRMKQAGLTVLRYDVETYETIGRLAEALLAGAARQLTGSLRQAGEAIGRMFAKLSPHVDYDLAGNRLTVGLNVDHKKVEQTLPLLTDVLDTIESLSADADRGTVVVLDEFQQVITQGGETAERQIRSVVQRHHHVAYIFAGSKTRLLVDMTNSPERAFWKLGDRHVIGPIPRTDFLPFLERGFTDAGFAVEPEALTRILDVAEDVPYNVQQLAHACWEMLRIDPEPILTVAYVDRGVTRIVAREDAPYTQLWTSLTQTQRIALRAVIDEGGMQLRSAEVLSRTGIASSTMTRTLAALDERGVIRETEQDGMIRYRLEDPFFSAWLRWAQQG